MRGFIKTIIRQNYILCYQTGRQLALELINWANKEWAEYSEDERGREFPPAFIRQVQLQLLEVVHNVSEFYVLTVKRPRGQQSHS